MKKLICVMAILTVSLLKNDLTYAGQEKARKKNILFIMADDLRPELGCYGRSQVKSPNIDRLAREGVVFRNACSQVPVCGASRASMLTGLRPAGKRFWEWDCKAEVDAPKAPTMNSFFRDNGYHTISNGKIFHYKTDSEGGWSEIPFRPGSSSTGNLQGTTGARGPAFTVGTLNDDEYGDGKVLNKSLEDLKKLKKMDKPFFLAVGFSKPHLPFVAPKKYWDLYEREDIPLPPNPKAPVNAPARSLHNFGELRSYSNIPDANTDPLSIPLSRELIHGYYACVSYIDALIGRLLTELEEQGLAKNTIVVLIGDHGWNLLEHGLWCKQSNYRTSVFPAFVMKVPGMKRNLRPDGLVELVDLFPTLCELTGLNPPKGLDGTSLTPVLSGASNKVKEYAFSRWYSGYSVISDNFIYTEWWDDAGMAIDRMLYDHRSDPGENYNVAGDPGYEEVMKDLSERLHTGFKTEQ